MTPRADLAALLERVFDDWRTKPGRSAFRHDEGVEFVQMLRAALREREPADVVMTGVKMDKAVEVTADEQTWDVLEREALTCPVLYRVVTLAREDRERAMIAGLLWFSRNHRRHIDNEVERLKWTPAAAPPPAETGGE
jgi:hypothetical protein